MIAKVAWRNIWRNPLRSTVLIVSILLGVWGGLFVMALSKGLNDQRTESMIRSHLSHVQVHDTAFVEDGKIRNRLDDRRAPLKALLDTADGVEASSMRAVINGMASSHAGGHGVKILGIDPGAERKVTNVHEQMLEGSYFGTEEFQHPVVLGEALLDKLDLDLHSKLVLRFQGVDGDMVAGAFRVVGVFETNSSTFDETHLFLRQEELKELVGLEEALYHETAIILEDGKKPEGLAERIEGKVEGVEARSWKELSPELGYADELMNEMMYIFLLIIMAALAFGIVNSMLMAVLERTRELGMLMAVGMNRTRVFVMILLETVYLGLLSGPLGILLSYLSIEHFKRVGIDLSVVAEGLRGLSVGRVIRPDLDPSFYWNITIIVILTAVIASIYPARKALSLNPAEAVRKV